MLIFDCDGVLIDSEALACRAWAEILADFGLSVSDSVIAREFAGYTDHQIAAALKRTTVAGLPHDVVERVNRRALALFRSGLQPIPGMDALLRRLDGPRCVASNSSLARLNASLRMTGLLHHFQCDTLFSAEQVAAPKPAPDLHLHAAMSTGADPSNCIVIEDSVTGVAAACAAGMKVVGFTGASHQPPDQAARLAAAGARSVAQCATALEILINEMAAA